jgi:hypothetical protein
MSNYLAVSQVTATLRYIVTNSLPQDLSGAAVTTRRPDDQLGTDNATGVNIYLYRVGPNSTHRNADLPTRDANGNLLTRPTIALDLDYLFTFYGDDTNLEPQRLMGAIAVALHEMPILSKDEISKALLSMQPFKNPPFTAAPFNAPPLQPDLGIALDRVRLHLLPLSLDELSKLWSVFYQIPYALTIAYQASGVLMQREDLVPQSAPPVQRRVVSAQPWNQPVIQTIASNTGLNAPILAGGTIVISGSGLLASNQQVTIDGYPTPVIPTSATDAQMTLTLPGDVPAGARVLRITRLYQLGIPATPHSADVSGAGAFTLQPTITAAPTLASGNVTVSVNPIARQGQTVILLLNEATVPAPLKPFAYSVTLAALPADTNTLTFPVAPIQGGGKVYFVRVQIDGAESGLDLTQGSPTFGPTVTAP